MHVVAIIPARYGSTRLPGKPLLDRTGKPLIQHVVEAVRRSRLVGSIYVATDDERIARAVARFGGDAVMTRPDHATGTDRLAEAARKLNLRDDDVVVNVQGDEPLIDPEYIDRLVGLIQGSGSAMATLAAPLDAAAADNPNKVKVVLACDGSALYFSRARIPFDRDGGEDPNRDLSRLGTPGRAAYLLHLGIYAYRTKFLCDFAALRPTPAEQAEKLEQLRALEHGYRIAVGVVASPTPGIDTMEDYEAFVEQMRKNGKPGHE